MNSGAIQAALELSEVFAGLDIRYLLGGSFASILWSEPRFTQDVDYLAQLEQEHVDELLQRLGERWYADETMIRVAIEHRSSFNPIRFEGMVKVDVFVPPSEPFHQNKWARGKLAPLTTGEGPRLPVTSPEDIVLQKLDWYRRGDEVSEQQWRDITGLLRLRSESLDWSFLETWAAELGLSELLTRAKEDALEP